MNRKGQALVEFVLILPIFILILFAVIDFGMILSEKSQLENISVDVITMLKNGNTVDDIEKMYSDLSIEVVDNSQFINIIIKKNVDIITPGLNLIFGDPYEISVERKILNDQIK